MSALQDELRQAVRAELEPILKDLAPVSKPALLDTKGLAHELGVCTKTIDRLRKQGLPHVMVGDACPRYRIDKVLEWLESRTSDA